MTIPGKNKDFGKGSKVVTRTYRGPDRRSADEDPNAMHVTHEVRFDARGNPVLDVRTNTLRRRQDDKTVDLIKCLDVDISDLELSDD